MRRRSVAITFAVLSFAGAGAGGAAASLRHDAATDALITCLDIAAAEERLSCLETAARSIKTARSEVDAAHEVAAEDKARAEEMFAPAPYAHRDREKNEQRLEAGVANIRIGALKNITVSLDNGQVWRQLEGDRTKIGERKISIVQTVTVKKGPVGGYWMTLNEIDQRIRVNRIK